MTTKETPEKPPELEPTMPAVMEESAAPILEVSPLPPPLPTPPPPQPEAEQGVSDGTLICTVCLTPVGRGEKYVRTQVRGINHLEPCSHRA